MSEQVQVRIKGMVITAAYGALSDGTILRTGAAFAKHLVEDCNAAEYIVQQPELTAQASEKIPARPRRKRADDSGLKPQTSAPAGTAEPDEASAEVCTDQPVSQSVQNQNTESAVAELGTANETE